MQVHPDCAALRGGRVPQPRTDAALARWRAAPEVAALGPDLARFAEGTALAQCPALARVLNDHGAAQALVAGLVVPTLTALRAEPLALLSFGHSSAPGLARLRLANHDAAALTLVAYAPRPRAVPLSAVFDDGTAHEIVVAGEGLANAYRLDAERLTVADIALRPATRLTRDGADAARQIIAVTCPLVLLQLTRTPPAPMPSREIALADGRVLRTISGCKHTSQQLMALGVLGALGHQSAVPAMARLVRDPYADRDLRWEGLRQCLALDAREGLALLSALAGDPGDALCAPAAALQAQWRAARPDLAALMPEPA